MIVGIYKNTRSGKRVKNPIRVFGNLDSKEQGHQVFAAVGGWRGYSENTTFEAVELENYPGEIPDGKQLIQECIEEEERMREEEEMYMKGYDDGEND